MYYVVTSKLFYFNTLNVEIQYILEKGYDKLASATTLDQ